MERKKTKGLRGVPKDSPRQKPTVKTTGPKGVVKDSPRQKPTVKTKGKMGVPGMAKLMSQGMSATAAQKLLNMIREDKPRDRRITQIDIEKYKMKMPRKMPNPKDPGTRPTTPRTRKNPLGPLRPIRERSLSKLTSRRRGMNKR